MGILMKQISRKYYQSMSLRAGGEAISFLWEKIAAGKKRPRNNKTLLLLMPLAAFFCIFPVHVHAQEISGQGWTVSGPERRSSSTASLVVTGSARGSARPSLRNFVPAAVPNRNAQGSMTPFPVLMPKTVVYPRKAIRKGWEGQTVVAAEVLPDGSVGRTALVKTSGHEVLDQAAQEAIQSWKFETEFEKNERVSQYVDIPVTFKLQTED
jgi:TonB family protein